MPTFTEAPEVERIAKQLIGRHHTRLADAPIAYVFRDKASKSKGRIVAGKARKVSGLNAFLADPDLYESAVDRGDDLFVVEIAADEWEQMGPAARKALVDHELCHFTVEYDEEKDEVTLGIRGHDVEEFAQVVERHGVWSDDLKQFAEAVKEQMGMFDDLVDGLLPEGMDSVTVSHDGKSVTLSRDEDGNVVSNSSSDQAEEVGAPGGAS